MRISAAIMTKHMYQPRQPTMKRRAPPVWRVHCQQDLASRQSRTGGDKFQVATFRWGSVLGVERRIDRPKCQGVELTTCNVWAVSYSPLLTFQYAPLRTHAAMLTKRKMAAKTTLVLRVKIKYVKSAKPQTIRYRAMTALYSGEAAPDTALVPLAEYGAARPRVGSCSIPKLSQKTAKSPHTIMEKKLPIIHSKMTVRMRSTGPTKKKIPLRCGIVSVGMYSADDAQGICTYTTGDNPSAPPQPIMTMAKVMVDITKLFASAREYCSCSEWSAHPTKPRGVGLAKRLMLSPE